MKAVKPRPLVSEREREVLYASSKPYTSVKTKMAKLQQSHVEMWVCLRNLPMIGSFEDRIVDFW